MEVQNNLEPVVVAILAGGKSSRMGADKAGLIRGGETLLARTVRLAKSVSSLPVLIIGRSEPDGWTYPSARFVPDESPGVGPAGGLMTSLQHARNSSVLALSCDMPALTEAALAWLLEQPRAEFGVVVRNGNRLEPLFAIYSSRCQPLLQTNLDAGKRSLHGLIDAGGEGFAFADVPPEMSPALANVNTPEQWAAFRDP